MKMKFLLKREVKKKLKKGEITIKGTKNTKVKKI
jgi:hypothetical protein